METLTIYSPGSGRTLREIPKTSAEEVTQAFSQARSVQKEWVKVPVKKRAAMLLDLRETLIEKVDDITHLLSDENGKPRFEAMVNEIFSSVELCSFFAKVGPSVLREKPIKMGLMKHRKSSLLQTPLGVVAVISPWNYPFLLPMGEIVMAVLAGNAVVFKPSEITPLIGIRIQELFEEAGFPKGLINTVIGDGSIGARVVAGGPDKIFFTGSGETGKKILQAAAETFTPVNLELGGKDAMIVMPDADLDYATSAALWGAFSNSGQVCASVERAIVHQSIAHEFKTLLAAKLKTLRQGPSESNSNDLGPITFEKQKSVYDRHIAEAKMSGAEFISGGSFSENRSFLLPTLVSGDQIESSEIYNEESFGPILAITTFSSVDEAIEKVNRSKYGLLASIITKDLRKAKEIALHLDVGTVTINEVVYTAGLPETPWGGMKQSGYGRKHSEKGLLEFTHSKHIHTTRSMLFVFKSFWWFPYTPFQYATFRQLFELYRKSWVAKLRALPVWLWNLANFLKREPRI
jgi:acyl-CoA reductase-like NAD-dependent aldehyde dehydrogenase